MENKRQKTKNSNDQNKDFYQDKSNRIKNILDILNTSKISNDDYDSTNQPFFLGDSDKQNFILNYNHKNIDKLPSGLNRNIINIYTILGSPEKEIYLNNWTIMSLNKCLEIYQLYCNNNQYNVFDIGYTYMGMGHIKMISCDLNTHLLFYRYDGGSNGYDREDNFQKLIKNGSSNYQQFPFSDWFFKINKSEELDT